MGKRMEYTADKQSSAIRVVLDTAPGISRAKADILIKSGEVRVNGARIRTNVTVNAGDVVSVFLPDSLVGTPDIPVVYDDGNIVVFNKPKRVLYDAILPLYGSDIYAVHRLDANTSGLIVFAKTERAKTELELAFRQRRVKKLYRAVVYPAPETCGIATAYLRVKNEVADVKAAPAPGYSQIVTEYSVVGRMGGAALLSVYPHTGRTHQIRAHLRFIGCPIVGDPKYGGQKIPGAPDSQMLAAVELTFFGLSGGLEYLNGKTFEADDGFDTAFLRGGA